MYGNKIVLRLKAWGVKLKIMTDQWTNQHTDKQTDQSKDRRTDRVMCTARAQ